MDGIFGINSSLGGQRSPGMDFQGKLWILLPWKCPRPGRTGLEQPGMVGGVEQDGLEGPSKPSHDPRTKQDKERTGGDSGGGSRRKSRVWTAREGDREDGLERNSSDIPAAGEE